MDSWAPALEKVSNSKKNQQPGPVWLVSRAKHRHWKKVSDSQKTSNQEPTTTTKTDTRQPSDST
jgi:hypothetical protein